ncbi:MAG: hypothetical protein ACYDB2_09320 [Acidimicrobiales bacterium]
MPEGQQWDVTVGGRVEYVTDDENFPNALVAALGQRSEISIVRLNRPSWPHTTSVVIRISAHSKKSAEAQAQKMLRDVFVAAAREIAGDAPFGWTMSAAAEPASESSS